MSIRWGILGCGDVCEVQSGPAFQKADDSALTAVMRRDRRLAEDFARRAFERAGQPLFVADYRRGLSRFSKPKRWLGRRGER